MKFEIISKNKEEIIDILPEGDVIIKTGRGATSELTRIFIEEIFPKFVNLVQNNGNITIPNYEEFYYLTPKGKFKIQYDKNLDSNKGSREMNQVILGGLPWCCYDFTINDVQYSMLKIIQIAE
jgi:hypothetical protein